jgi:hypothetical protein
LKSSGRRTENLFCPDCGREAPDDNSFCPICGYPLAKLAGRIEQDKIDGMGWAEKIVGKPQFEEKPPGDEKVVSFITGKEAPPPEEEKKGLFCERCEKRIDIGVMCASCGDRLPFHSDFDPFLLSAISSFWKMALAPRSFAINFPYPIKGGIIQPVLYPGVAAAVFILTLPLVYFHLLVRPGERAIYLIPVIIGFVLSMLVIPVLVYLSSGLIHFVAQLIGGKCQFRRTVRVFAAGILWILILGIIHNLIRWGMFTLKPLLIEYIQPYFSQGPLDTGNKDWVRQLVVFGLLIIGWLYTWAFGSLYRLRWWVAIVFTLATYIPILWIPWVYLLVILPLRASGLF